MKISFNQENVILNNIFSGSYYRPVTGRNARMYAFSSPATPIKNFDAPYDAKLLNTNPTGKQLLAVASRIKQGCEIGSDRTGVMVYFHSVQLPGTCHGHGATNLTYIDGYNYYNSFYPAGYHSPPFGENISVFQANLNGYDALKNGGCSNLTVTEYNEEFGVVSKSSTDAELASSTLTPDIYAPIYSPKEVCPGEVTIASYYDEIQFNQIAGNSTHIGGTDYHNSNPIPTSLDAFNIKVNGRYSIETVKVGDTNVNYIRFTGSRPISSYTISDEENKLNNALCFVNLMESRVSMGKGTNGTQLVEAPDALKGAIGDQVSFAGADPFHYWHWTFKENAASLPFLNNFPETSSETQGFRRRSVSEGTPLFAPVLSSESYYWENRQCPATVDYLPWTFGASIYACPSEHFDIPYYAALKKFGFYGTRFLNTCKALNLQYPLSGVEDASEMPTGITNYELDEGAIEPEIELDKDGYWSFTNYANLLKTASVEERYSNMYALNRGFFIWANKEQITGETAYQQIKGVYPSFEYSFNNLTQKFQNVYTSGLLSFTGSEPLINLYQIDDQTFTIISSGANWSNLLTNNDEYVDFKETLKKVFTGVYANAAQTQWDVLEQKYGFYVRSGDLINEEFYKGIISGREKRLMTRYFENTIRGNPIDLFPMNNITFSFDKAKDYIEHTGWGRKITSFGANSSLPEVNRRYFEGAYGRPTALSGLLESLSTFRDSQINYYYPGFFNDISFNKTLPRGSYVPVTSGLILDTSGRRYSPSGWLALGYNEIGALDNNFSCFTPIFTQSPVPKVFCKIGQKPTFRALAVDYHTIPEDKISRKYPEIIFWAEKLKLLDCNKSYLYPLKYKWFRTLKTNYNGFIASGDFGKAEFSNKTGDWCCLEGDGAECTLIHPKDCVPVYTGVKTESNYTFIKGAINNLDDQYYYMCLASGRFGVRISNPSELKIEDWLRFDVSVKNGMNVPISNFKIDFDFNDVSGENRTISLTPNQTTVIPNYAGYQQNIHTSPETVIEQKIPPPNNGWGDVTAYKFIGPVGYVGGTRSYVSSALKDTRGLREVWGHLLEYGQLVAFEKRLEQKEGEWLYGYKHLPVCEDYQMPDGKHGIKVTPYINDYKLSHWSLDQLAVASVDNKAGIQWDRLTNVGELYPPVNSRYEQPHFGIGHWQWGNNLGAIKRFGKFSTRRGESYSDFTSDIIFVGGTNPSYQGRERQLIARIKEKVLSPNDLAGENCGYTKHGLGRNMIYYLEAYDRFYLICDAAKKKNVTNRSFISPAIRMTNSGIQYFWLGKPTNTYLRRRPMYGPYAYQWQVKRHNRDRNGNGVSEGFYSMGHTSKYSLLYDAPAIYGLYPGKKTPNSFYRTNLSELKTLRDTINIKYGSNLNPITLRDVWFGEKRNEGTSRAYGNIIFSCDPAIAGYNKDICDYVSAAQFVASNINFKDHYCTPSSISEGKCFDPCLSMRYSHGFTPGGKLLDMFGYAPTTNSNELDPPIIKLLPLAQIKDSSVIVDDIISENDSNYSFRPPIHTPHARITMGLKTVDDQIVKTKEFVGGMSPCQDGGSDHCNYLTPTMHLDSSSYLEGVGNGMDELKNFFANVYLSSRNIVGENS